MFRGFIPIYSVKDLVGTATCLIRSACMKIKTIAVS
uniref:Uncharacterized protein n=1 Tax=Arundo donax TaxID=35708 RepID=A0A0A9DRT9_ARUDO